MTKLRLFVKYIILKYWNFEIHLGVIHKPFGHGRGKEVCQMSILLQKPYLVKLSTKGGEGGQNVQNSVHVVYRRPLGYFFSGLLPIPAHYIIITNCWQGSDFSYLFDFALNNKFIMIFPKMYRVGQCNFHPPKMTHSVENHNP